MTNHLEPTVRAYMHSDVNKRFIRIEDLAAELDISSEDAEHVARAANALYTLPKIKIVKRERLDEYLMKHIYKVPGTNKQVVKKFARIGEGSIIYSIGHHRFIEMARAAGATYKINEGTGGTVLINLEIFDAYMEQFRQDPVPMKHPLYDPEGSDE